MKKTSIVLIIALIGSLLASMPTFAATEDAQLTNPYSYEFDYEGYHYAIRFDQFADKIERVFGDDWEIYQRRVVDVPVLKTPAVKEVNSWKFSPLKYRVETNNPDARYVIVQFASAYGGQLGIQESLELLDGQVEYTYDMNSMYPENEIFLVDLYVYDEDYELIVYAYNMYIMFDSFKHSEMLAENKPQAAATATAQPNSSKIYVDGEEVQFQAYTINGNNYFKLRDLAYILNDTASSFSVEWDGKNNAISITTDEEYVPVGGEMTISNNTAPQKATLSTSTIYFNGEPVQVTAYTINGNNYVKLRDIAAMVDFDVFYDPTDKAIHIDPWYFYRPDF